MLKVIYLGTPDFAIAPLKAIMQHHKVVAVVTQPDKKVGRNQHLTPTPVKQFALENDIPVYTFERINKEGQEILSQYNADIMVTCAYGQILRKHILDLTPMGVYNIHGSILPRWRGAAPIQWAVLSGDTTTGITILKSDIGMDDGDILLTKEMDILPEYTAGDLFDKLTILGAEAIVEALTILESGDFTLTPQDDKLVTHARMLEKEDCLLSFSQPSKSVVAWVKGLNPSPIALIYYEGQPIKVYDAKVVSYEGGAKPGEIIIASPKQGLVIATIDGAVELTEIQAQNSKRMPAKNYLNGKKMNIGSIVNE